MQHDLVVRGGEIFDGSGGEPFTGDLAVQDGRIVEMGPQVKGKGAEEIDARGLMVTPGFVDVHTHYDGQATWDSRLNPSSSLGATTVVMGNCGVGFAPCKAADHEVLVQLMEGVEEIPGAAMDEGLPWNWETFPEYLDSLAARPRDIDIAALLPHGPLRVYVMGERAVNREPASEADLAQMQALVKEGLAAGAVGFSTSRTLVHRSATGDFIPTYQAATAELKFLGAALASKRGSVFQMISDWEDAEDEFSILRETAAKTGAKGTFTLLDLEPQPNLWREHLDRIEAAQAEGLDIRGQVLSRPIGMLMGHPATMSIFYKRPTFMGLASLPWGERLARLRDPAVKAKILQEENDQPHVFVQIFKEAFEHQYPLTDPIEYLPAKSDSVAARAARENRDPAEWLYDYFLGNDGANLVYIPAANFSAHIPELLRHPHTVAALGDGGAHVGTICDTSANLYILTKWVKERGEIELSEAVRLLTRQPAELYSLQDRGLLAPGLVADINLLDYDALSLRTPQMVHDLPAGGKRFLQAADGIAATIKSGHPIYRNNHPTEAFPGTLLRGAQLAA